MDLRSFATLGLSLFLAVSAFATEEDLPPTLTLTLTQAGQKALKNSPAFLQAEATYRQSQLQTKNNRAVFFPSLDLLAIHGPQYAHPNVLNSPDLQSSTQLMLTESLYDNGESYKKFEIAKLVEEQNRTLYQKAKGQVLLNVVQSYYDWCFAVLQMQFTQKYSTEIERQFNLASAQFHQGVKTRADYMRFKTQAQRSELDLIDSQKAAEKARQDLLALMGVSTGSGVQFSLMPVPAMPNRKIKTGFTVDDLPEHKVLDLKYRISDLQNAILDRRNLPQFYLTGAWQYGSQNYWNTGQTWQDGEGNNWNVLLTLKWNLWDWGVRSRNEQIQALQENIDQQGLRSTLLSAENDLSHYKTDEASISQRLKIASDLESNEKSNMKELDRDYHAGRISYLDLITGLSNLLDAQSRKLRADFDMGILYAREKYYEGTLDENTLEK